MCPNIIGKLVLECREATGTVQNAPKSLIYRGYHYLPLMAR